MCEIADGLVALGLAINGLYDARKREVPLYMVLGIGVMSVLLQLFCVKLALQQILYGLLIGIGFLGMSKITKEAIGYGDSLLIFFLGIYLGGKKLMEVILAASMGTCVFALLCGALLSDWKRKQSVPFIPFLTAAYLGVVCF